SKNGMCIRIDNFNINDKNLPEAISRFTAKNGLSINNTDILVDLGLVDSETSVEAINKSLSRIPQIKECRTFILSSGAFPPDLTDIEPFTTRQIARNDWLLSQKLFPELKESIREPIYSDFTIQ